MSPQKAIQYLNVSPFPKPSMSKGTRYLLSERDRKYMDWRNDVHLRYPDCVLTPGCTVVFFISFPKSYSKKKRKNLLYQPHLIRPDRDNLIKALQDALHPGKDSHIYDVRSIKVWSDTPLIAIIPGVPLSAQFLEEVAHQEVLSHSDQI